MVKSLVCNKLCEIYRSVSEFIVERILYAYKQTIRTDIFESKIESFCLFDSSGYYNLRNIRNFFDEDGLERWRRDSISVFVNKDKLASKKKKKQNRKQSSPIRGIELTLRLIVRYRCSLLLD